MFLDFFLTTKVIDEVKSLAVFQNSNLHSFSLRKVIVEDLYFVFVLVLVEVAEELERKFRNSNLHFFSLKKANVVDLLVVIVFEIASVVRFLEVAEELES